MRRAKNSSKTYLHGVDSEWLELTTCSRHMELVLKSRHSERTTVKSTREVQGAIEEEVRVVKVLLAQPSLCSSESLGGMLAEF